MRRTFLAAVLAAAAVAFMWGQSYRIIPDAPARFEVRSVLPKETSPGIYAQVDQGTLEQLAGQGWELVGVTPYIYRNEEHGPAMPAPRPIVTQVYPAYFFKRYVAGRN
jgi:hypothetical protein